MTTPVSLQGDDEALTIAWSDGVTHRLTWRLLRNACPCATCRDEREQSAAVPAVPENETVPASGLLPVLSLAEAQPLRVRGMKPVGNYAYGLDFTDGHTSGIYTLEQLRYLGEASGA